MAGELDYEPVTVEAFPGLEFYLSGDRDHLHLNSMETSDSRHLQLLSIARQGFIVRHSLPGDFTPIPPRDEGRIPFNDAGIRRPGQAAPRAIVAPRFPAAPPRPTTHLTPDLPFRHGSRVRLRGEEGTEFICLECYAYGRWYILARLTNDGRLSRFFYERHTIEYLRQNGFCLSRDGAITISNPQLRRARENRDVAPEEPAQLEPIPENPRLPDDMTLADKALAFRAAINTIRTFFEANENTLDDLRGEMRHANLPVGPMPNPHGGNWTEFLTNIDRLREYLLLPRPPAIWVEVQYLWHSDQNRWNRKVEQLYFPPRHITNAPQHIAHLPWPPTVEGQRMRTDEPGSTCYGARRNGWTRSVWFNEQTGEIRGYDVHAPDYVPEGAQDGVAFNAVAHPQGGGEGGFAVGGARAGRYQAMPVAWDANGPVEVAPDAPAPQARTMFSDEPPFLEEQNQGQLTTALAAAIPLDAYPAHINGPHGVCQRIITFRRTTDTATADYPVWLEFDEEREQYFRRDNRDYGLEYRELPGQRARDYRMLTMVRMILETAPGCPAMLRPLTPLLNATIDALIRDVEGLPRFEPLEIADDIDLDLDAEGEPDEDMPEPEPDFDPDAARERQREARYDNARDEAERDAEPDL